MTTLHVAFRYGDRRWFARLVVAVCGGDAAHCEVVTPLGGGQWRCISSSWMDGGPRAKHMALPAEKWRIYATSASWDSAEAWLDAQRTLANGYGWWKLLRFVLPFLRPSWGGPICTEACAEALDMPDSDAWNVRQLEAALAWQHNRFQ